MGASEKQRPINANESELLFLFCLLTPRPRCPSNLFLIFFIICFSCNHDAQSREAHHRRTQKPPLFFHPEARLSHYRAYLLVLCDLNYEPRPKSRVHVSANVYPKKTKKEIDQAQLLSMLQSHLRKEKEMGGTKIFPAFAGKQYMGQEGIEADMGSYFFIFFSCRYPWSNPFILFFPPPAGGTSSKFGRVDSG